MNSAFRLMNSNSHGSYTWIILCRDIMHCSRDSQPLYSEKNIKNGFYGTIYTFKIYFTIVFSVFSKISCI